MRGGSDPLPGVLGDHPDERGRGIVLQLDEETGPEHGTAGALALSNPEDPLCRRWRAVLITTTAGESI